MMVRRAELADVDEILRVDVEARESPHWFRERYVEILLGDDATWWPRRALFVAVVEGRVAGFVAVAVVMEEAELESIVVGVEHRRQGVGMALSLAMRGWAKEQGAERVQLEVRVKNEAAQALYKRLGFAQNGLRANYYSNPQDDAVLMSLSLL
jgi:ribosomal-protein-alanine N-acetyltransferase